MFYRIGYYFFSVLSVVLFVAAIVAYFWVPDAPGAILDETTRDLPSLAVGRHEVRFQLENPTRHVVRVVGAGEC